MRKRQPTQKCAGPSDKKRKIFKGIEASLERLEEGSRVSKNLQDKIEDKIDDINDTLDNLNGAFGNVNDDLNDITGSLVEFTHKLHNEVQATHELLKKLTPPEDAPGDLSGSWTKCPGCEWITPSQNMRNHNMVCPNCGYRYFPRAV